MVGGKYGDRNAVAQALNIIVVKKAGTVVHDFALEVRLLIQPQGECLLSEDFRIHQA